jgi:hypothetical protein
MARNPNYPPCWPKVSQIIRRLAQGRCEHCRRRCALWELSVHHLGTLYADGRPGDPQEKHDIRRENLVALCLECHRAADAPTTARYQECKARREQHRSLGVGTGLVLFAPEGRTAMRPSSMGASVVFKPVTADRRDTSAPGRCL